MKAKPTGAPGPETASGAALSAPDFPDPVKRRIVTELATFQTLVEIRELLRDEYGIEAALPDIARHDPGRDDCLLDETLRARFGELRELFVHGASDLPLASQPYRIRRLDRLSLRAEREGDAKLAAAIIDQAAKDLRAGPAGAAGAEGDGMVPLTPEQARKEIAEFLSDPERWAAQPD